MIRWLRRLFQPGGRERCGVCGRPAAERFETDDGTIGWLHDQRELSDWHTTGGQP